MNSTHIIHLKETESTNTYAKALLKSGEPFTPYTLIYTDNQTAGRGRLGRNWESQEGNSLCMSLIVPFPHNPRITLIAALAVYDALYDICGENLRIKWPNDLIIDNKKLCGILTESTNTAAVIGIGVNLNQTDFSEEIRHKATSLKLLTQCTYSPSELAEKIGTSIRNLLENTQGVISEELVIKYTHLCANMGNLVGFRDTEGFAIGVREDDGALMILTKDGLEAVTSGEVTVSGIY